MLLQHLGTVSKCAHPPLFIPVLLNEVADMLTKLVGGLVVFVLCLCVSVAPGNPQDSEGVANKNESLAADCPVELVGVINGVYYYLLGDCDGNSSTTTVASSTMHMVGCGIDISGDRRCFCEHFQSEEGAKEEGAKEPEAVMHQGCPGDRMRSGVPTQQSQYAVADSSFQINSSVFHSYDLASDVFVEVPRSRDRLEFYRAMTIRLRVRCESGDTICELRVAHQMANRGGVAEERWVPGKKVGDSLRLGSDGLEFVRSYMR